jgi:hypothetical protein
MATFWWQTGSSGEGLGLVLHWKLELFSAVRAKLGREPSLLAIPSGHPFWPSLLVEAAISR